MVAIVRGLGYAGAYLGGDHQADHIRWIIKRSEAIANRWEEFAEELNYAPQNGFYLYTASKGGAGKRGAIPAILDALGKAFPVNRETALRRALARVFGWVDRHPGAARGLERLEFALKRPLFGCEACGNCVLGHMEYVCPQTCPKHLRNGPCGGTLQGRCEVVDQPCIWVAVYERAVATARIEDLKTFIPPPDRKLTGTSSWINYFLGRDNRPGSEHPLVTIRGLPSASRTVGPAAAGVESKPAAAPHQAGR